MRLSFASDPHKLRINSAGITACASTGLGLTAGLHWNDLDLWVVLQGSGLMETPQGPIPLERGKALLLRGGELYRGMQNLDDRLTVSFTHFDVLDENGERVPWENMSLPPLQRSMRDMVRYEGNSRSLYAAHCSTTNGIQAAYGYPLVYHPCRSRTRAMRMNQSRAH